MQDLHSETLKYLLDSFNTIQGLIIVTVNVNLELVICLNERDCLLYAVLLKKILWAIFSFYQYWIFLKSSISI